MRNKRLSKKLVLAAFQEASAEETYLTISRGAVTFYRLEDNFLDIGESKLYNRNGDVSRVPETLQWNQSYQSFDTIQQALVELNLTNVWPNTSYSIYYLSESKKFVFWKKDYGISGTSYVVCTVHMWRAHKILKRAMDKRLKNTRGSGSTRQTTFNVVGFTRVVAIGMVAEQQLSLDFDNKDYY
jgi:hypothetical protein